MRCDKTIFLLLVAYSSWQLSLIPLPNSLSVANLTLFWLKLYQDGVFADRLEQQVKTQFGSLSLTILLFFELTPILYILQDYQCLPAEQNHPAYSSETSNLQQDHQHTENFVSANHFHKW